MCTVAREEKKLKLALRARRPGCDFSDWKSFFPE